MKKRIVLIISLITIIGLIYYFAPDEEKLKKEVDNSNQLNEYFSALEGKSLADEEAKKWKKDAELFEVNMFKKEKMKQGNSTSWQYIYYSPSTKSIEPGGDEAYMTLNTIVNYQSINKQELKLRFIDDPIKNWNIDSDVAIDILMNNETINKYFIEYPYAELLSFELGTLSYIKEEGPVWYFMWDETPNDIFSQLMVILDATNGKILEITEPIDKQ